MKPHDIPASLFSTMTSAETEKVMHQVEEGELREIVKRLSRDEQLLNVEQVGSRRSFVLFGESTTPYKAMYCIYA